ncbi:DUF397 domain-containing protein [Streptomyces sp. 110]|uniref:DUF397 domain-containing protein n=1 Tax=Streptomyces endocoffeicus TaxID=2898945 RepID=A0ABS1PMS5_9ACTN|nr:DUF397 domain-containing protein [Streptomyces endocoffeicus]MBL1113579.1 DUF397 domain-containing protein [Streptomyces endocoffeicus]
MKSAGGISPNLSGATWRSSTYSGGNNECVEVADDLPHVVHVRDSKRVTGPVITFSRAAWGTFLANLG